MLPEEIISQTHSQADTTASQKTQKENKKKESEQNEVVLNNRQIDQKNKNIIEY